MKFFNQICWPNHCVLKNIMISNRFVLQTYWCVSVMKRKHDDRWMRWKNIIMIFWWKKNHDDFDLTKSWWFFSGILDAAFFLSFNLRWEIDLEISCVKGERWEEKNKMREKHLIFFFYEWNLRKKRKKKKKRRGKQNPSQKETCSNKTMKTWG